MFNKNEEFSKNQNKYINLYFELNKKITSELSKTIFPININLKTIEIEVLFSHCLQLSINTFIERLIRISNNFNYLDKKKIKILKYEFTLKNYYLSTYDMQIAYHFDNELNEKLLEGLKFSIIDENIKINFKHEHLKAKDIYKKTKLKRILKTIFFYFKNSILKFQELFFNNDLYYSDSFSTKLSLIFPKRQKIIEYPYDYSKINKDFRKKLRRIFKEVIIKFLPNLLNNKFNYAYENISEIFSYWVDCSFPISIIENLNERYNFYNLLYSSKNFKYLHSEIGLDKCDNYKVLCLIAKKNNKIILGHDHGINNFVKFFDENNNVLFPKSYFRLKLEDYYIRWDGKNNDDWGPRVSSNLDINLINIGSVYLNLLNKRKNIFDLKNKKTIIMSYLGGPLRKHQAHLGEISSEENLKNRLKIYSFLKKVILKYNNIVVFYKPFNLSLFENDPIKDLLNDKHYQKKIFVKNINSIKLMEKSDFMFYDMISTGFAESINMNIPSIVYSNDFDYNRQSDGGKNLNEQLKDKNIIFYDDLSGMNSINLLIKDLPLFHKNSKKVLNNFINTKAKPVSKKEFLIRMKKKIL